MHVWRDVLWSSFTDELTKIARANAVAKTMRMPSGATRAAKPPNMLKNIRGGSPHRGVGYSSSYVGPPMRLASPNVAPMPGTTLQAPSMQVTGAGPVAQTGMSPRIPQNMPNPLIQASQGMPPPMTQSGPMNMNMRRY